MAPDATPDRERDEHALGCKLQHLSKNVSKKKSGFHLEYGTTDSPVLVRQRMRNAEHRKARRTDGSEQLRVENNWELKTKNVRATHRT